MDHADSNAEVAEEAGALQKPSEAELTGEAASTVDGATIEAGSAVQAPRTLHDASRASPLARRIGPAYTVRQVADWLTPLDGKRLSQAAIRKRIHAHTLAAVRTDDRRWALPTWQFTRTAGQLHPRREVLTLWRQLPHDSWMDAATLAAWMATRLAHLDGLTPVEYADRHGTDHPDLLAALSRLRHRAA